VTVDNGVVTLDGELPTRAHKRLTGVLAWWVPGTRDVVDGLRVLSPEPDNDGEITDAVRAALEKDPFVDASQLRVSTKAKIVTLTGLVWSRAERSMAESDAWFVFGVAGVINNLQVADVT
jgi:osmotically-inducible protein OsmY